MQAQMAKRGAAAAADEDKDKKPESTVYRDGLRYYFVCTRAAITGEDGKHGLAVVAAGSPLEAELKRLTSELNEFIKSCYNNDLSQTELADEVNSRGETLVKQLIAGQPGAATAKKGKAAAEEEAPADAAPDAKAPAKAKASATAAGKAPAGKAPADKVPPGKAPADQAPADAAPATDDGAAPPAAATAPAKK
jgi:hypothetical protein